MSTVGEAVIMQLVPLLVIALVVYLAVRRRGSRTRFIDNKNADTTDSTGEYGPDQREKNRVGMGSEKIIMLVFRMIVFLAIPVEIVFSVKNINDIAQIFPASIFIFFWCMCFLGLKQIKEWISKTPDKVAFLFNVNTFVGFLVALFFGPLILFIFGVQRALSKLWNSVAPPGRTRLRAARIRPAQVDWPAISDIPLHDLRSRIQHWLMLVKTKQVQEDGVKKAGEEGERKVLALMDGHRGLKDAHLFAGRRVPKTKDHPLIPSRRSEIDLIILTPKAVHVIEVKNWSGEVWEDEENPRQWFRRRRNRDAETIHSVVDVNRAKAWSLCNYLKSNGVTVVAEHIHSHIFFTNPNLKMDIVIENMPDVVTVHHIGGFLSGTGTKTLDRIILLMAKLVLDKENSDLVQQGLAGAMPQSMYDQILTELDQLHTWDRLHLHGGAIETGDFLWAKSHGQTLKTDDLHPGEQIRIQWQRGRILSLLKAVMGKHLGHIITANQKIGVDMQGHVLFHFAGQPEPAMVHVTSVDIIERG
ncbi:MAG: nuclease-related domain-containing protein [Acidithiobacillus sp.]|nr:nuclease-related domain-containing protein [Acidithiobacillus sp.]